MGNPKVEIAHVPSAFGRQGSTLMTVAQRISDVIEGMGSRSSAILSHNRELTLHGAVDLHFVDYTSVCPREWFSRRELAIDILAGRAGHHRPYYGHLYDPAIGALLENPAQTILLYEGHYASASLPRWRRVREHSEVVLYVHNPLSRSYGRRELERLLDSADRVAFCADHLRRDVEQRIGRTDPRFITVHNGVDRAFLIGSDRTPSEDVFQVLYAGRVTEKKGVHLVLEAVERALESMTRPIALRIIGSADYASADTLSQYERSLRAHAEKMSVEVEFVPFLSRADLITHLRNASVMCLPSQWAEGLPLAALEAMATGLPVVCSDSPGLVEACADAAIVVPGGAPDGLAAAFVRLADDDEWARRSRASRERASAFTWEGAVSALIGKAGQD